MKKKIKILFLLLAFNIKFLQAQNTIGIPNIVNFNKNNFYGISQTWCIKQDNNGVMYFANNDGLLTYDGNNWKIFSLPNKTINRCIEVSIDGKIYMGGQNELGYFLANEKGDLEYHSLMNLIPNEYLKFADIWNIEIINSSVFFRSNNFIFELKNEKIITYKPKSEWLNMYKVGESLYVEDKIFGLYKWQNNTWLNFGLLTYNNLKLNNISSLIEIGKDSIFLSTLKFGCYIIYKNKILTPLKEINKESEQTLISKAIKVNTDIIVLGTNGKGCLIINKKGNIIQRLSVTENLQDNDILSLFLDVDKNLWAGLNKGISIINYDSPFKIIKPKFQNELSGYSTLIYDNKLFIASSNGVYNSKLFFENKDLSFSKSSFLEVKNTTGQVWKLSELNNKLFISHSEGLFYLSNNIVLPISKKTGAWLPILYSTDKFKTNLLLGTYNGIEQIKQTANGFINANQNIDMATSIRFFNISNDKIIWASHPLHGVYKIIVDSVSKKINVQLLNKNNGLPSNFDNYVFKIKNKIVIATIKGIYEFDETNQNFKPSTKWLNVFKEREIQYLVEDKLENIWFMNDKEIGVAVKQNDSVYELKNIPELTNKFLKKFQNIYPYNLNNIFIGSEYGVIHLNYEKYVSQKNNLKVYIRQVKAIGEYDTILHFGFAQTSTKKSDSLNSEKSITSINHPFNSIHFEFSTPIYGEFKYIEYSYKLEGYENKWSPWTTKKEKDYTNLPSRNFTFLVKARNNLGFVSDVATFTFSIKPPWYLSLWAYIVYLFIGIFILRVLKNMQKKKYEKKLNKLELEKKHNEYIFQLEIDRQEKEIFKLQAIKLENEMVEKNKELVKSSLQVMEGVDALNKIKIELEGLGNNSTKKESINKILSLLNNTEYIKNNWTQFAKHFDELDNDFLKKIKLKFPKLTLTDLKLCAYLKLNLSSKEIAQLLNISTRGVEIGRYRLRKKLNLNKNDSIVDFFLTKI